MSLRPSCFSFIFTIFIRKSVDGSMIFSIEGRTFSSDVFRSTCWRWRRQRMWSWLWTVSGWSCSSRSATRLSSQNQGSSLTIGTIKSWLKSSGIELELQSFTENTDPWVFPIEKIKSEVPEVSSTSRAVRLTQRYKKESKIEQLATFCTLFRAAKSDKKKLSVA